MPSKPRVVVYRSNIFRTILCTILLVLSFWVVFEQPDEIVPLRAATTRKVYTGGTSGTGDTTYTLSQLQDAIDDAAANDTCGSEILIEQNVNLSAPSGGFVLKQTVATPTWDCITVRTGVDSAGNVLSASLFPATDVLVSNKGGRIR